MLAVPAGLLDSLLPFVAKLHDSIPDNERFNPKHKPYLGIHKQERAYSITHYKAGEDGFTYCIIRRLEPSLKKDKYASICCRFKRLASGGVDTSSFEEIFRTWKMKPAELTKKTDELFEKAFTASDLSGYYPEKSRGEWIEFPGNGTWYDSKAKIWVNTRQSF